MGKTQKVFFMVGSNLTEEEKENNRKHLKQQEKLKEKQRSQRAKEISDKKTSVDFMNVNFEPFEDRILVYPDPIETVTKGGLHKPDEAVAKDKPVNGTVVAVGPGKFTANSIALIKALGYQADNEIQRMREEYPKWNSDDFNALLREGHLKLSPGDRISYGNYAGTDYPIGDVKYLIMRFADCFGKVV